MGGTPLKRNRRNVILTGLPRSGTTLVCHLLNQVPDTVALLEPVGPGPFVDLLPDGEAILDTLELWYRKSRRRALKKGEVLTYHVGGTIPDNPFGEERSGEAPRQWLANLGRVRVGKELQRGFFLVVKEPPMFTALLPLLVQRFPAFAVVRNPLAVLASWNTVDIPARRGRIPKAERFDPELTRRLDAIDEVVERQLCLLDWWCERFERYLPASNILRYEDIVASGGKALAAIVPGAQQLNKSLSSRNANELYQRKEVAELGEKLLGSEGAYWRFYSRNSVEELLARMG
jgi:hypothetical protein